MDLNSRKERKWAGVPESVIRQKVMATFKDNTRQNTDKGQTPSPRIEIKIPDPARDSTEHVTATDQELFSTQIYFGRGLIVWYMKR